MDGGIQGGPRQVKAVGLGPDGKGRLRFISYKTLQYLASSVQAKVWEVS